MDDKISFIEGLVNHVKVVRWTDGRYSIRKGWLYHTYKDLTIRDVWRREGNTYFSDCKGSLDDILAVIKPHKSIAEVTDTYGIREFLSLKDPDW